MRKWIIAVALLISGAALNTAHAADQTFSIDMEIRQAITFNTQRGSLNFGIVEAGAQSLTVNEDNPNRANVLVLVDGGQHKDLAHFDRCLDMFDGNDQDAVTQARQRWKVYKDAGHAVTYWQQNDGGKWEKKGS